MFLAGIYKRKNSRTCNLYYDVSVSVLQQNWLTTSFICNFTLNITNAASPVIIFET